MFLAAVPFFMTFSIFQQCSYHQEPLAEAREGSLLGFPLGMSDRSGTSSVMETQLLLLWLNSLPAQNSGFVRLCVLIYLFPCFQMASGTCGVFAPLAHPWKETSGIVFFSGCESQREQNSGSALVAEK